jgi:hypothetical protein
MMGFDIVSLQKSKGYRCFQQPTGSRDMSSFGASYSLFSSTAPLDFPWFHDEALFHLDGFVNKQNMRFWASENSHRVMETLFHPS